MVLLGLPIDVGGWRVRIDDERAVLQTERPMRLVSSAAVLLALMALSVPADAQKRCTKGIPCGNTCIAANKTCRIGTSPSTAPSDRQAPPRPSSASATATTQDTPASGSTRVWLNTGSGVYHCPGTRWYGQTKAGEYLTESAAVSRGYRPAGGKSCAGLTATPAETQAVPSAPDAAGDSKVWVNTSSRVYHCPGTRWYGATVRGAYMTEAEARRLGHRPAGGRACS